HLEKLAATVRLRPRVRGLAPRIRLRCRASAARSRTRMRAPRGQRRTDPQQPARIDVPGRRPASRSVGHRHPYTAEKRRAGRRDAAGRSARLRKTTPSLRGLMDIKKLQALVIDALEDVKAQDIRAFD